MATHKCIKFYFFLSVLLFTVHWTLDTSLYAAGDFSGNVLLRPPSAKLAGMAEAAASLGAQESGIAAFHYNPSAPAYLKNPEISLMGQKGIIEDSYGSLFYGHPTVLGTFSAGALFYSLGDIELINTSGVSRTVSAEKDLSLAFNYAEEFFGILGTGITLKYLNSKLVDSVSANSFAFDAGIETRLEEQKLSLGASILNIGSDLKYLETQEPLPLTVRIGGSYRLGFENYGKAVLALDFVKERESDFKQFIGADYSLNELISIRGGYKIGQDAGNIHAGLGFVAAGFNIDYAISSGKLGQAHSASVSYRFGGFSVEEGKRSASKERERRSKEIHQIRRPARGQRVRIAVLGLNALGAGENTAAILADELFLAFTKKPKAFEVVDSDRVRQVVAQSGVDLAQCTDIACLKNVGVNLNAEKIVTGLLTKSLGQYSLTVQMVDVETGAIEVTEAVKSANLADMEYEIRSVVQSLAKSAEYPMKLGGKSENFTVIRPASKPIFHKGEVVAILNLEPQGVPEHEAKILSDTLQTTFVRKEIFTVVERSRVESVFQEFKLHLAICNDIQCLVKVGKMLEATKIILGSVGKLGDSSYVMNLRVINIVTGTVEFADRIESPSLKQLSDQIIPLVNGLSKVTE